MNALVPPRPRLLLLCPKSVPAEWWFSPALQKEIGFLHAPFPADPRLSSAVRLFGPANPPVLFVGDMDPVAIAQYLAARQMLASPRSPHLLYGGMNDAWLGAMAKSDWPLARLGIRMSRSEMRLLHALESVVLLEELLGPDCARLLQSGFKVELEAGLNPAFHTAAHKRWVWGYLRAVALEADNGRGAIPMKGRRTRR